MDLLKTQITDYELVGRILFKVGRIRVEVERIPPKVGRNWT